MPVFVPIAHYTSSRFEYMWYQSWQSGYHDILKRGFPKPNDDRTVLAELRSPNVPDFLHGGGGSGLIPFLVSDRARKAFESGRLTGFEFGAVIVAKITTKGLRRREVTTGEPEDPILKSRGISLDHAPSLHAVHITASVDVIPDYDSGRTPTGLASPFRLPDAVSTPDLWCPSVNGTPFKGWLFCSDRFKAACESSGLSAIKFEDFDSYMERRRESQGS
jgi:hypothetical protein